MIRAVIADDSNLFRTVLIKILEKDGRIKVEGAAADGKEAVELVKKFKPDVLILDYQMPVMDGLETLKVIMRDCPLPVLMLSALTRKGAAITVRALEIGALDYFSKPVRGEYDLEQVSAELVAKIVLIVSENQRGGKILRQAVPGEGLGRETRDRLSPRKVDIIAVGSSTGGVQAAVNIISSLPEKTKPIVWVQHMPATFTASFAERLNSKAKFLVKEAEDGDILSDSVCYIAKAGYHVIVEPAKQHFTLRLIRDAGRKYLHCPACDVLFQSVADIFGDRAVGAILTGMGDDGTRGLLAMHEKGAFILGQSAESSVVYGMAKAAYRAGAVDLELNLDQIAEAFIRLGAATR